MIKLNKWLTKSFCQTATLMITTALANSPANAVDPLQQAKNHLKAGNYAKALEYCVFRSKMGNHSGRKWATIPVQNGQRFRLKVGRILSNATTPTVYENHIQPG